jgi:Rad3-related DNA helicase
MAPPRDLPSAQACLSQQLALVQGPPGTGKTHLALQLMRVLLGNLDAGQLPVLCVCYTNHALDQFLEGILQLELIKDPNEMVRIGSKWAGGDATLLRQGLGAFRIASTPTALCLKHASLSCVKVQVSDTGAPQP